jgi:adenylate cyclase
VTSRFTPWRPFVVALTSALLVALLFAIHRLPGPEVPGFDDLEQDLLEARFIVRGPRAPDDHVALLVADEVTMRRAPEVFDRRLGWKRTIDATRAAGAALIVVDVFFMREEQLLSAPLIDEIKAALSAPPGGALSDDVRALLERVIAEVSGDEVFAQTLGERDDVILAFHFGAFGGQDADVTSLRRGTWGQITSGDALPASGERVVVSLPAFYAQAAGAGMATVYEDRATGRVMAVPLARRLGADAFLPISVAAVAAYKKIPRERLAFSGVTGAARIGDGRVPSTDGDLLINYRGPTGTFPTYPLIDLLEGRLPNRALEGKIVLIGYTDLGQDTAATPFSNQMPGLEVHANAIDSLLQGDVLDRSGRLVDVVYVFVLGLLMTLFFLPGRVRPWWRAAGLGALVVAVVVVAQTALGQMNLWVPLGAPLLVLVVPGATALMASYLAEGLARQQMKRVFARYLSDELLDELVKDPSRLGLQGERRRLTILFTDIRSFTSWSEAMEPLALASFLNHFFTPMSAAVLENNGFLDKYIGDAIMAVFGAPVPRPGHAADACRCALAMHKALLEVRATAAEQGIDLNMGVGINTGDVVVGNLGSEARFDYTVIGDPVNLASRIEGLTKRYGVFCLVGEATVDEAGAAFDFRAVDLVRVKGKQQPAPLFELCLSPYAAMDVWDEAMAAWRSGDLGGARRHFEAFAAANASDSLVTVYLERLDALNNTAPDGWDGVFTYQEK